MVSFGRVSQSLLTFQSSFLARSNTSASINSSRPFFIARTLSSVTSSSRSPLILSFAAAATAATVTSSSSSSSHSNKAKCLKMSTSASTGTSTGPGTNGNIDTGYLNAKDAYDLDQHLFDNGYTLEQLMELAGLAVAEAVYDIVPLDPKGKTPKKILIVAGPGNNGGDGLVAGRHLKLFGYDTVHILYPKRSKKQPHYEKLVIQCHDVGVEFMDEIPKKKGNNDGENEEEYTYEYYDAIIDSIFGFSFQGVPREPFASILNDMMMMQKIQQSKIISVDVPSGWDVNDGPGNENDGNDKKFMPDALISLTAPKNCAKLFTGRHYVGGRFLPPHIAEKYNIRMPPYPGVSQVMEVSSGTSASTSTSASTTTRDSNQDEDDWAAQYAAYCEEKEEKEKIQADSKTETDATMNGDEVGDGDDDDWALQYQNYCIEKEEKLAKEEANRKEQARKEKKKEEEL